MSWLSSALSKSKIGRTLNAVAKPIQSIANPVLNGLPVIGQVKQGVEALGQLAPASLAPAAGQAVAGAAGLPGLSALTGNNGMNALAVAQALNAANLGKQSSEYAKNAMKTQDDLWAQRAPLRAQGIAGMQAAPVQLPQLAALGGVGNPFARAK
jgi:hypothetical protein